MTPRADWAVRYIEKLGFALVPIPPGSKGPIHPGWNTPSGYFTNPAAARQHWIAHPQDNMGAVLAPSGLCSLDVDHVEHSRSVFDALGWDLDRYRTDYPSIQGNPARFRLLFRAPAGVMLNHQVLVWPANKGDKPITVFELRAGDIQDVLPPSIHPDTGKPYVWLTPPKESIPELPAELLELWQSWSSYKKSLEGLCPWGVAGLPPHPQRGLEGISVIAEFNRRHPIEDLLEQYGYKQMGKRYLAPSSASKLPGVTVKDGACYSHHASDVLNDGHSHDAFDLYRLIEHGGDSKAAVRAAAAVLGLEAPKVKGQSEPKGSASDPDADPDQKVIAELVALSPLEYDRRREAVAKDLGVRVATLDKEVAKARGAGGEEAAAGASSGKVLSLEDPEPWPEPVNGAALLERLRVTLADHVILPEGGAVAAALWIMHSYVIDAVWCSPILAICSPEKRCGKTTLLGLLGVLVRRPLPTSNISPAAVFRSIEAWQPTLLIDEADTFIRDNEELRGVINSGHTRATAFVIRTVGDDHEPRRFSTWAAKAIALIGNLPSTLADRSVPIRLRRKRPDEQVRKWRLDCRDQFADLPRQCQRWAQDHHLALIGADPDIPTGINDRAADNWRPLLGIADLAGGPWPALVREALRRLLGEDDDAEAVTIKLLGDIRHLFASRNVIRIPSAELAAALAELEDRPWPE